MAIRGTSSVMDSNLNISSPINKAMNTKSAKVTTKTTRKRDTSKNITKLPGPTTKTQRKRINDLGQVYDTKTMMVPAVNGSMVRTST